MSPGWIENKCYPGTHWLYYDRGDYKARVDYADWTGWRYQWRVMYGWFRKDVVGWSNTLEEAQRQAERVMNREVVQLDML
jgi:hypothetical protein